MKIDQDPSLRADPILSAAVAEKDGLLATVVNGSAAEATWDLDTSAGRPQLHLRLRDREGKQAGEAEFDAVELKNEARFAERLGEFGEAVRTVAGWLATVEQFFDRIRPWCEGLPGDPEILPWDKGYAAEARSGGYEVPALRVRRGGRVMSIRPIGAWVLGADGRVDMIGPGDRAVLEYRRAGDEWFHVPNDLPYRELPLTEPLFRELAAGCLDDDE